MPALNKFTGWLVLGTLVFYLLSVADWVSTALPTLCAWGANAAMWKTLPKGAKRQVLILMGIGVLALIFAATQGIWMTWREVLAINLPMLAMFVAVSFLDLTSSRDTSRPLPKGLKAIVNTAFGVQLLGAVINMSVIMVFADRMKGIGRLSSTQQFVITRSFSAAAWWSPFFVATGVALTYAPGMKWQHTVIPGIFMGLMSVAFSTIQAYRRTKGDFEGYPIRRESLFVPLLLSIAVIICHFTWQNVSILVLICLIAPIATMLLMKARPRKQALLSFVDDKLPRIGSQFALFLAAGLFSNGIKAIILCYPQVFDVASSHFSVFIFAITLAGMILVSYVGVHPVISVAVVSPILLPLHPEPTQLGFLFFSAWAISTGSSALTGLGLLMTGRYQVPASVIVKNSWRYALCMWFLASFVNAVFL